MIASTEDINTEGDGHGDTRTKDGVKDNSKERGEEVDDTETKKRLRGNSS